MKTYSSLAVLVAFCVSCDAPSGMDGGSGGGSATGGGTATGGGGGGGTTGGGGGTTGGGGGTTGGGGGTTGGGGGAVDAGQPVDIQILAISDWHGQLDPVTTTGTLPDGGSGTVEAAGASTLSAYFARDRQAVGATLTVTAGDEFGASPPLAAYFNEEPAGRST